MNKVFVYSNIMLFSVFISSLSQIMLKKSALKTYTTTVDEYLNPYVILAYFIFFISTIITIYALKYVPLSTAPIIESTGYIFILFLSKGFLNEKISNIKMYGIGLIMIGILIFNL